MNFVQSPERFVQYQVKEGQRICSREDFGAGSRVRWLVQGVLPSKWQCATAKSRVVS